MNSLWTSLLASQLALLIPGCATPDYDAGTDAAVGLDGSSDSAQARELDTDADAGDGAALRLRGTYVVRTRYFQKDSTLGTLANSSQVLLQLAQLDGPDDALAVRLQLCSQQLAFTAVLQVAAEPAFPTRWPARVGQVVLDGPDTFHLALTPTAIGYGPAPAACMPGGSLPGGVEQPWLSGGECSCASASGLPTSPNDCRVTDPDSDHKPGVTIDVSGTVERFDYVRNEDSSQIVNGRIADDGRHTALYINKGDYAQLECSTGPCSNTTAIDCAPETTSVEFAPLPTSAGGPAWDCDRIVQAVAAGQLLPTMPLAFPAGC